MRTQFRDVAGAPLDEIFGMVQSTPDAEGSCQVLIQGDRRPGFTKIFAALINASFAHDVTRISATLAADTCRGMLKLRALSLIGASFGVTPSNPARARRHPHCSLVPCCHRCLLGAKRGRAFPNSNRAQCTGPRPRSLWLSSEKYTIHWHMRRKQLHNGFTSSLKREQILLMFLQKLRRALSASGC